jgi:hypothetical protein
MAGGPAYVVDSQALTAKQLACCKSLISKGLQDIFCCICCICYCFVFFKKKFAILVKLLYFISMITIRRNPNFTEWFDILLSGKLIDNARTMSAAISLAESIKRNKGVSIVSVK